MIEEAARKVACDIAISDDELTECCVFLEASISKARSLGEPVPFLDYRNLRVFEAAVKLRDDPLAMRKR